MADVSSASITPERGSPSYLNGDPPLDARPSAFSEMESLDYDIDASSLYEQDLLRQPPHVRRRYGLFSWIVCCMTGLVTGILAFALDELSEALQAGKFALAEMASRLGASSPAAGFVCATLAFVALCTLLVAVAATLVIYVEPVAAGSGIPEVKSYLQGCRIPRMLRITTLICKAAGVLCSVAGGLVCGKEGPMIHAGAVVAAGLSQGSSKRLRIRTMLLKRFRNDHDKRDFVSAGAAAGVAAAFGAPIGGVLFALEEAATHWSQQLTWRTFFCALCSTFSLNLLLSSIKSTDGLRSALIT